MIDRTIRFTEYATINIQTDSSYVHITQYRYDVLHITQRLSRMNFDDRIYSVVFNWARQLEEEVYAYPKLEEIAHVVSAIKDILSPWLANQPKADFDNLAKAFPNQATIDELSYRKKRDEGMREIFGKPVKIEEEEETVLDITVAFSDDFVIPAGSKVRLKSGCLIIS